MNSFSKFESTNDALRFFMVEWMLSHMRSCACCGRWFEPVDWLCTGCESRLFRRIEKVQVKVIHPAYSLFYLWDWRPEDRNMKTIVESLKGGRPRVAFAKIATLFYFLHPQSPQRWDAIYYPSKGTKDHAYEWAQILGQLIGCPSYPLRTMSRRKQAKLPKSERQKIQFLPQAPKGQRLLFVDDIVTSGATARGAFEALGQPKNFAVWAPFYRRLL
ncbi:MAG: hypothetical protein KDD33_04175 [Bdellovibrionales bacterium]|nr:hypothetical protein [Bdellovibrionales bacterium]